MSDKINVERPTVPHWYGRGRAPRGWYNDFHRAAWAWDLASRHADGATAETVAEAASLLDAINRYAIADAREWELDNGGKLSPWAQEAHERREAALDKRREKLQERLKPFAALLDNYGLYPSVVDADGRRVCGYGKAEG
jgi:hypothetical protein